MKRQPSNLQLSSNRRFSKSFSIPHDDGRGFTLVELMISCAILLTISAMAIPSALSAITAGQNARAVGDIRAIGDDLQAYYASNAAFPQSLSDINDNYNDPWGNAYAYVNFAYHPNAARKDRFLFPFNTWFDLYSMGADGQTALGLTAPVSQDDIIWANDGEYVGLVSDYEE
jgi:general secretion pathway protein G